MSENKINLTLELISQSSSNKVVVMADGGLLDPTDGLICLNYVPTMKKLILMS